MKKPWWAKKCPRALGFGIAGLDFHKSRFDFYNFLNTVKPVYNGHPWDPKIEAVVDRWFCSKLGYTTQFVIGPSNWWPLLPGGCYSEVAVSSGLTVLICFIKLSFVRFAFLFIFDVKKCFTTH